MKQFELAKQLGITPAALSQLIHGKNKWELERAIQVSVAIGRPARFLITASPIEIKQAIKDAPGSDTETSCELNNQRSCQSETP